MDDMILLKEALRHDLTAAMKERDRDTASVLRTALAALNNAEAVAAPANGHREAGAHVAGASGGVGSTEASRRVITGDQARQILIDLILRAGR